MNWFLLYLVFGMVFCLWAASYHKPGRDTPVASWKWAVGVVVWPIGAMWLMVSIVMVVLQLIAEREK